MSTTVSTTVDPQLYAEALAELRALRPNTTSEPEQPAPNTCCKGTRGSYQVHRRRGEEACPASKAAAAAWQQNYRERTTA